MEIIIEACTFRGVSVALHGKARHGMAFVYGVIFSVGARSVVKSWLEDRFNLIPMIGFVFCIGTGQCFHVAVAFRVVPMVDLDSVFLGIWVFFFKLRERSTPFQILVQVMFSCVFLYMQNRPSKVNVVVQSSQTLETAVPFPSLLHSHSSTQLLHSSDDFLGLLLGDVLFHHLGCALDEFLAVH